MEDFDEFEFKLEAFTPQTIPMERLAEYLAALAKLLGNSGSVHLEKIELGSTCPIIKIDHEAIPKVDARLKILENLEAANDSDVKAAFDHINELCRYDNATGALYRRKQGVRTGNVVLLFEGKNLPKPVRFGPFFENITFDGELVRIGGKDKTAHAQILDPEGEVWNGEMTKDLAASIAQYLYKGALRVSGKAKWLRDEDGNWIRQHLTITAFVVLEDDTLLKATERLRHLKDTEWHEVENVDDYISIERGDGEALH